MQPKQPKAETQAMSEYGEPWILMIQGTYMGLENERGDSVKLDDARNLSRIGKCVSVLAGIPNPEAVRELIRWAKIWNVTLETDEAHWEAEFQMSEALAALTAPSASPQQK